MSTKIRVCDEVRADTSFNPAVVELIEKFYDAAGIKDFSVLSDIVCDPVEFDVRSGVDGDAPIDCEDEESFVAACYEFVCTTSPIEVLAFEHNPSELVVVTLEIVPGQRSRDDMHYGHYEMFFWATEDGEFVFDGIRAMDEEYVNRHNDGAFFGLLSLSQDQ